MINAKTMRGSVRLVLLVGLSFQAGVAQTPDASPAPDAASTPAVTNAPPAPTSPPADAPPISGLAPASGPPPPTDSTALTLDYLYNRKPQEGTAGQAVDDAGKLWEDKVRALDALTPPGMDDPIHRDQFETYLNLPEVSPDRIKKYGDKISQIFDLLKSGDGAGAVNGLHDLGDYDDLDAGVSHELALEVETILQAERISTDLNQTNADLRSQLEAYDWNADQMARDLSAHKQKKQQGGGLTPGKLELSDEYSKILDAQVHIKLNDLRSSYQIDQARTTYAGFVTTLYSNHRHDQVILAVNFYRRLCPSEICPPSMNDQVDESLAANQQVDSDLQAFQHSAGQGNLVEATNRLVQAFLGNPCRPALQGVPRLEKERVYDYLRNLDVLKNALETHDFAQAQELVARLKKNASDFDTTKPLELIDDAKVESKLHLGKARLLAQQGDLANIMVEFQSAADLWPGNPDLQSLAEGFFNSQDLKNHAVNEFDRLVKEQDYRAVYEQQAVWAAAIAGDTARGDQLKTALEKVKQAQLALETANGLARAGNIYGAWETIDAAVIAWPEDVRLNRLLTELSARGPDFAVAIRKAREAEAQAQLGYSLTWYVNARSLYPASQIAKQGIERVSGQILAAAPAH